MPDMCITADNHAEGLHKNKARVDLKEAGRRYREIKTTPPTKEWCGFRCRI
jgi:hypothetical protein